MLDFGTDRMPPLDLLHVINQMANDLGDTAQTLNNVRQDLAAAVGAAPGVHGS
jgi:hypothetical protein